MLEGIAASSGGVGDAYDNALAESTIGLFKTEVIAKGNPFHPGPCKSIEDVEYATMEWVDWFNRSRLHSRLGYVPPDEFEAAYYAHLSTPQPEPSPIWERRDGSCLAWHSGATPGMRSGCRQQSGEYFVSLRIESKQGRAGISYFGSENG